ncbi:hypothetical protein PRVXT_001552 [Proteinivorax tanatarense]|uniref:Uncharacterized protein n=1 Tax=Proteinivorax tanatarense TaxID=1260629 RepID=A0AAU7VHP3_9FIRM
MSQDKTHIIIGASEIDDCISLPEDSFLLYKEDGIILYVTIDKKIPPYCQSMEKIVEIRICTILYQLKVVINICRCQQLIMLMQMTLNLTIQFKEHGEQKKE